MRYLMVGIFAWLPTAMSVLICKYANVVVVPTVLEADRVDVCSSAKVVIRVNLVKGQPCAQSGLRGFLSLPNLATLAYMQKPIGKLKMEHILFSD